MTSSFAIRLAAHHVRRNGIILYPTETVYGLGCNPKSFAAVSQLNTLKQRDNKNGFLLLASNIQQLKPFITQPSAVDLERIHSTTTPTSWITQAHCYTPPWLVSANGTIGFRLTQHSVTKALCEQLNHPIISTSANLKGKTPVSSTMQCHTLFKDEIDFVLTSSIPRYETSSKILNLTNGKQLR